MGLPPPHTVINQREISQARMHPWCGLRLDPMRSIAHCSLAVIDRRVGHTILHLSLSSVILTDSFTGSPVHVLMFSIQAVRGLTRLRAPGMVPCIISFSRHDHSMLASLLTPALLRTHSFVFFAVHETRRIFLSPFVSKESSHVPEGPAFTAIRGYKPHQRFH